MRDEALNSGDDGSVEGPEPPVPPSAEPPAPGAGPPPDAATPPAPPSAQVDAAAQLRRQLAGLGIVSPLPAVGAALVSYLAALISAVVVLVILVAGLALAGGGAVADELGADVLGSEAAVSGIGALVRMPFQFVALAVFGSYGLSVTIPFGGELVLSLRFMPLLVTAVFVVAAYIGGRTVRRLQPATTPLGIAISSALGGLAVGLLVVIAARLFAQPIPVDGMTLGLHAAGFDAFAGALVLSGLALAAGQLGSLSRPRWWAQLADLGGAVRLAVVHALVVTVVVGLWLWLVFAVRMIGDGEIQMALAPIVVIPLLIGQIIAAVTGLSALSSGAFSVTGSAGDLWGGGTLTQGVTLFDLPWYAWLIAILLSLITLVAISVLWNHDRRIVPGSVPALVVSWTALPGAYFLGAVVLMIVGQMRLGLSASSLAAGAVSLSLAVWTPLLLAVVGVLVELASRFLAPFLAPVVPPRLVAWFRRPATAPSAHPVQPAGPAPQPSPVPQGVGASPAAPSSGPSVSAAAAVPAPGRAAEGQAEGDAAPVPLMVHPVRTLSPTARRRLLLGGGAAGALLVVGIGALIAVNVVASSVFSPSRQVDAYLGALEDGRYGQALELSAPNVSHADRVLLTDEIGAATQGRLTGHSIETVETDGDTATVTVTLEQDGVRSEQAFSLTRSGRTLLVFPEWTLDDVGHRTVQAYLPGSGTTLEVNGVLVDLAGATRQTDGYGLDFVELPVLPGSYTIAYQSPSEFLTSLPHEFVVEAAPGAGSPYAVAENVELSADGLEAITDEVTVKLDDCAEQTVPAPEDCPFSAFVWASDIQGEWEIVRYPELTVEPAGDGSFRVYSGGGEGQAAFTYLTETFSGEVERTDEPWISISAVVTFPEGGGLEVEFL